LGLKIKKMSEGKCVLLDRDGVLNEEKGDYVFRDDDFIIPTDVPQGLKALKEAGFSLVVVTNQGGINKGLYPKETVYRFHEKIQQACDNALDFLLFAPWHRDFSLSLSSKPGSLMMERGLALTESLPEKSWLIGDAERDLVAGKKVGVSTILIPTLKEKESPLADFVCTDFKSAVAIILNNSNS
jgi:D-glycero-D-manno-heptose 1,7-bisphosphate phosphatase